MRKLILPVILSLLAVSCSTLGFDGRPSWVDNPPVSLFSTVLVSEGKGESEEEADRNAYLGLLSSISERTGLNYTEKYYEELSSTDMISAFNTVITMKYRSVKDGVCCSYMLSTTDSILLDEVSERDNAVLSERETRVKNRVDESLSYYRDNRDVDAVNSLLDAIEITFEGEIRADEYQRDVLVGRLEKYVSQIEFESSGTDGFRIYRNKGIMKASIEDAGVIVYYPSLGSDGNVLTLFYDGKSDENGIVTVNRTNAYTLKKGTMSITIDVDWDVISRIDEKDENLLSPFKALLEKKVFTISYSDEERYRKGEAVIALAVYGYDGNREEIDYARSVLSSMCDILSISNVEIVEAEGEDEEEALSFLNEEYSSTGVIYMIRIGIVDRIRTLGTWYTKTEGKIVKIDNRTGKTEEYKTMQYSSSSDGEKADDRAALEKQLRLTSGLVLGEF